MTTMTRTQPLADGASDLADQASPALDRWSSQAETAMRRGVDAVRETSAQLRGKAYQVTDATAGRVRDDPLKSVAIAAVAGAVLMGLIALFAPRRGVR